MIKGNFKVKSHPKLALGDLKTQLQTRIIGAALKKGALPIQQELRSSAPSDSGALRTSISMKIAGKGKRTVAVVGPRSKYQKSVKKIIRRPSRYAGLLQYGTKHIKPRRFYDTVWKGNGKQFIEIVRKEIAERTAVALAKYRK